MRAAISDHRLEAIAGKPILLTQAPTITAARTVVIVATIYTRNRYLIDMRADSGPGYAYISSDMAAEAQSPAKIHAPGPVAVGEPVYAWAVSQSVRQVAVGAYHTGGGRWEAPMCAAIYDRALTDREARHVINRLSLSLSLSLSPCLAACLDSWVVAA